VQEYIVYTNEMNVMGHLRNFLAKKRGSFRFELRDDVDVNIFHLIYIYIYIYIYYYYIVNASLINLELKEEREEVHVCHYLLSMHTKQ
jgi:hypothetical protein